MHIYIGLIALGVVAVGLLSCLPFLMASAFISFISLIFASIFSVLITYMVTRKWMEEQYERKNRKQKEENDRRVRRLKKEHDTTTLEKTIRDGTNTLIKNALDYFKIENIKNEIGTSAAIENLQLDKYGQIIELLADFSLILPDINENQKIVEEEITHQIKIYRIDENPFALFLERIMKKYLVTVDKKIREKQEQEAIEVMKICPECAEKVLPKAKVCKHCGHKFNIPGIPVKRAGLPDRIESGKKLMSAGRYDDAIKEFDIAIQLDADNAMAFYNRAILYSKIGNQIKALEDLEEASSLGHKKAKEYLSRKR